MSMVSISLFSFNNFMVGVIFRLYGITYLRRSITTDDVTLAYQSLSQVKDIAFGIDIHKHRILMARDDFH